MVSTTDKLQIIIYSILDSNLKQSLFQVKPSFFLFMNNNQSKSNENLFQMDKTQKGFQSNYSELIRFDL